MQDSCPLPCLLTKAPLFPSSCLFSPPPFIDRANINLLSLLNGPLFLTRLCPVSPYAVCNANYPDTSTSPTAKISLSTLLLFLLAALILTGWSWQGSAPSIPWPLLSNVFFLYATSVTHHSQYLDLVINNNHRPSGISVSDRLCYRNQILPSYDFLSGLIIHHFCHRFAPFKFLSLLLS